MSTPLVEILYFDGCPNREPARALVDRIAGQLGVKPAIELVEIPDADTAAARRFLGSPTVRVNGSDVEPGADERDGFVLACRVYQSEHGLIGIPDSGWILNALAQAGT
jgi:hypothetical protein